MRRGIATFTLDTGHCPPYLWKRMVRLGKAIVEVIVEDYGPDEFVRRIADPVWFQALGTVLAFDWNASGLTTVLTGALKEAIKGEEEQLGIFICGGKGRTSRKTPSQIQEWASLLDIPQRVGAQLVYTSKMTAKVDSSLIQDGYQLYHHNFFFALRRSSQSDSGQDKLGAWAVVQQGMNKNTRSARRYHWYDTLQYTNYDTLRSSGQARITNKKDFVNEPHAGIASQTFSSRVLNLVANKSSTTRAISTQLAQGSYESLLRDITILRKHESKLTKMIAMEKNDEQLTLLEIARHEFNHHPVVTEDFTKSTYLDKILQRVSYEKPKTYEELLALEGVGPKTMRALTLIAEVIYGAKPSYTDPARYSYAHGGKDGTPYPVDEATYDATISVLEKAVRRSALEQREKDASLQRLSLFK